MAIDINVPSQVKTYANLAAFPATGSLKTIFIAEDTNKTYRWTGSVYVEVSAAGATGITIGTTAITSGTVGRVLFEGTGNVVQESANLFWDNTNGRLGIGTASPTQALNVSGFSVLTTSKTTATPILAVTNTTSSNPNSNNFDCFAPNMPSASVLGVFYGGKNLSSKNNFGFNWNHVSDGSTGNSVSLEMVSVANIIRAWGTGNVGINTGTDAGFKLDVNGTARFVNDVSFNGSAKFGDGTARITGAQIGGQGANNGVNTLINNGADWVDDTNVSALAIRYNQGVRIPNTTRYPLTIGSNAKATASAQIEMVSTTQGFLPPRMTTTQKNAIATPATGLMVYDTTLNVITYYNGTTWI